MLPSGFEGRGRNHGQEMHLTARKGKAVDPSQEPPGGAHPANTLLLAQ